MTTKKLFRGRGGRTWDAMPRFRLKEVKPIEYFFAARFKREHKLWMLWNDTEWSLLEDYRFFEDFVPSNHEARDLLMRYARDDVQAMSSAVSKGNSKPKETA